MCNTGVGRGVRCEGKGWGVRCEVRGWYSSSQTKHWLITEYSVYWMFTECTDILYLIYWIYYYWIWIYMTGSILGHHHFSFIMCNYDLLYLTFHWYFCCFNTDRVIHDSWCSIKWSTIHNRINLVSKYHRTYWSWVITMWWVMKSCVWGLQVQ